MDMNEHLHQMTVQQLRDEGYAVIVWTPEELGDCPPDAVEESSIQHGWDVIDFYNRSEEDEQ